MTTEEKIIKIIRSTTLRGMVAITTLQASRHIQSIIREEKIKLLEGLMAKGHKWMDDCDNADPDSNIKCKSYEDYVDYMSDLKFMLENEGLREEGTDKVKII